MDCNNGSVKEFRREDLMSVHPQNMIDIAIPQKSSGKVRAKIATLNREMSVPLSDLKTDGLTVIESLQITSNGLFIAGILGETPREYGESVLETMILRMEKEGMSDFYSALSGDTRKTRYIVYALEGGRLTKKFTLMGLNNMRVINDLAIHGCGEKGEIRAISLRDIARGAYLPSSFLGISEERKDISFIGRPNLKAYNPYVPLTFSDGTSRRLNIESLLYGKSRRPSIFLAPEDILGSTVFSIRVGKVIGKIPKELYAAVCGNKLVVTPKKWRGKLPAQ